MKIIKAFRSLFEPILLSDVRTYEIYWQRRNTFDDATDVAQISPHHRKYILSEIIEDGCSLLDVGCGNCSFFDILTKKKPNIMATGVEISEEISDIGRNKGYRVLSLDLTKEKICEIYDYITIMNVLEHICHAEEMVLNVKESFRKSLFISVPNLGYIKYRMQLGLFGKVPNTGCFYHIREHLRFWTHADFIYWAEYYGRKV